MGILNAKEPLRYSSQQYRGITYVKEVSESIDAVLRLAGGAYNYGSQTDKSMYEITKEFLSYIDKNLEIIDTPSTQNLWMNCDKAKKQGVIFSTVEKGLVRCANDYLNKCF